MKTLLTILIILLTCSTSYGQLAACFKKSNGELNSILKLNQEGTFSHKIFSQGHLAITSFENGKYSIKGDTILFIVTEYGIDENELQPQSGSLIRDGNLKNKAILLLAKEGHAPQKLRKVKCW